MASSQANERCCCGASVLVTESGPYLSTAVVAAGHKLEAFREAHAPCRAAWVAALNTPNPPPAPSPEER